MDGCKKRDIDDFKDEQNKEIADNEMDETEAANMRRGLENQKDDIDEDGLDYEEGAVIIETGRAIGSTEQSQAQLASTSQPVARDGQDQPVLSPKPAKVIKPQPLEEDIELTEPADMKL